MTGVAKWIFGLVTAVLAAVLSTIGVALYEHYANPSAPTHTEVRLFNSSRYQLNMTWGRPAVCNVASTVDYGVMEAHRCFAGRFIYDPCWGIAPDERVFCTNSPWDERATPLRVTRWTVGIKKPPWERTFDPEKHSTDLAAYRRPALRHLAPWALELANHQRCTFVSGATYTVAGMRANYFCSRSGRGSVSEKTGWIVGAPDRTRSLWRVLYARSQQARTFDQVDVYVAWY